MKRYILSSLINDRSKYPEVKPSKPATKRITAKDIRPIFETGLAKSKLAGHELTYFSIGKDKSYNCWEVEFRLADTEYKYSTSNPYYLIGRLSDCTPEHVAAKIDNLVDSGELFAVSDKSYYQDRLERSKSDIVKAVNYCLDKYDCEGELDTARTFSNINLHTDWILLYVNIEAIGGVKLSRDKWGWFISPEGIKLFYNLQYNGEIVDWRLNKSYKENLAELEAAFKQTINTAKLKLGQEIDFEDHKKLFTDKYTKELDMFAMDRRIPGFSISNIKVSYKNNEFYLTFDLSAYDGAVDITLEFSESELASVRLENKLKYVLRSYKKKLGI